MHLVEPTLAVSGIPDTGSSDGLEFKTGLD